MSSCSGRVKVRYDGRFSAPMLRPLGGFPSGGASARLLARPGWHLVPARRASQRPLREDGGLEALSSPLCRAFAVASAPAEHRESLPLSLSFVVWLEQSVLGVTTSSAQVLRLGFVLVCVWASLRWGDFTLGSLWVPPARVQYQMSVHALVGTSVRTKTTKRGMPWLVPSVPVLPLSSRFRHIGPSARPHPGFLAGRFVG